MAQDPWFAKLKEWRLATHFTRESLAARAGVSSESIKAYEFGRRKPPREVLTALLDTLSVHALQRDWILEEVGYASDGRMTGKDRLDPEHSWSEALAEIEAVPWPAAISNEAMDTIAANAVCQRLWGVDLSKEFNTPVHRNLLAQMSNPRIADQLLNWEEAVRILLSMVKGSYGDVAEHGESSGYFQSVMAHFLAGEPRYVQAAMRLWMDVEPAILKWRFRYPVVWQHPREGVLRFEVVVNPVNRAERIVINDWIPIDAPTWDGVRRL